MIDDTSQIPSNSFVDRFLNGLPHELAASFTSEQLAAIQHAFGMRYAQLHAVDLRRSFGLAGRRFYVVLLAGPERQGDAPPPRSALPLSVLAAAVMVALVLLL